MIYEIWGWHYGAEDVRAMVPEAIEKDGKFFLEISDLPAFIQRLGKVLIHAPTEDSPHFSIAITRHGRFNVR